MLAVTSPDVRSHASAISSRYDIPRRPAGMVRVPFTCNQASSCDETLAGCRILYRHARLRKRFDAPGGPISHDRAGQGRPISRIGPGSVDLAAATSRGLTLRYSHPCFNMYGKYWGAELPIGWLSRTNLGVR